MRPVVLTLTWMLLVSAVVALAMAVATSDTFARWRNRRRVARLLKQFASTVNFDEGASRL